MRLIPTSLLMFTLTVGCGGGDAQKIDSGIDANVDPGGDADADAGPGCETTLGTFSGQVIRSLQWEEAETPAANALVIAQSTVEGEAAIQILADANGEFYTSLPEDSYEARAESSDGCVSNSISFDLTACGDEAHTLRLIDCLEGSTRHQRLSDLGVEGLDVHQTR